MNANINEVTNPVTENKKARPIIGGQGQRIDNIDIALDCLEEGVEYVGEITDSYITQINGKNALIMVISYDEFSSEEFLHILPFKSWSPVKAFLKEVESEIGYTVQPMNLVGITVKFTVKYNTGSNGREYCNIHTIDDAGESMVSAVNDDSELESEVDSTTEDVDATEVDTPAEDTDLESEDNNPFVDEDEEEDDDDFLDFYDYED